VSAHAATADGGWGEWNSWNNCSATCNNGIQIRRRACDNPAPTVKGKMCKGKSIQVRMREYLGIKIVLDFQLDRNELPQNITYSYS